MIVKNAIQCRRCQDVVESLEPNDPVYCSCGTVAADGGKVLVRRIGRGADYVELLQKRLPENAKPRQRRTTNPRKGGGMRTLVSRPGGEA